MDYNESDDYRVLQKLSDLEKMVEGGAIAGRLKGLTNLDMPNPKEEMQRKLGPIKNILRMRFSERLPIDTLHSAMDSGMHEFASHVHARKILLRPQEALYTAIGEKSKALYHLLDNITLTDIIGMIRNKAAVRQSVCPPLMRIDRNDVPNHIMRIMRVRSIDPEEIIKTAKEHKISEQFVFTTKEGEEFTMGGKFVEKNHDHIQRFINDGVIIKMIQLYSSGKKSENLIKKAGMDIKNHIYLAMIYGL